MKTGAIFLIGLFILLLAIYLTQYEFNIYELRIRKEPDKKSLKPGETMRIYAIPVNAFGRKVRFRNPDMEYNIRSGEDLIEISEHNTSKGVLVIKAGEKPGKAVLTAISKYTLAPNYIEITINPDK